MREGLSALSATETSARTRRVAQRVKVGREMREAFCPGSSLLFKTALEKGLTLSLVKPILRQVTLINHIHGGGSR